MAKEYVQVYRCDPNNVGDAFANPLRYFASKDTKIHTVDIVKVEQADYPDDVPVIVGGGGLIANENFGNLAATVAKGVDAKNLETMWNNRWICKNSRNESVYNKFNEIFLQIYTDAEKNLKMNTGPKVIWGAGHNERSWSEKDEIKWPKWMSEFNLVGVRDYLQGFEWVPCTSCMHPAFDKKYEETTDIIFFEHKKQFMKPTDFGDLPVMRVVNSGQDFDKTIEFLASAKTVVTNSYHGVYWGTLLGKKVVCVEPWSSKFFYFKHKPTFAKSKNWQDSIPDAVSHPTALNECREANINFWKKVQQL